MSHNKIEGNILLDFYGQLLTSHQLEILEEYYINDLSMSEIAINYKVSKSAISDIIKRSYEQLVEYENKLNMIKNHKDIEKILFDIKKDKIDIKYINKLEKIIRR